MQATSPAERVGHAIREARERKGETQSWLGKEVARRVGRTQTFGQNAVSLWERGERVMTPEYLMAAEDALDLRPGTLTLIYGFIRATADVQAHTVEDAVRRDIDLTPDQRDQLVEMWKEFAGRTRTERDAYVPRPGRPPG